MKPALDAIPTRLSVSATPERRDRIVRILENSSHASLTTDRLLSDFLGHAELRDGRLYMLASSGSTEIRTRALPYTVSVNIALRCLPESAVNHDLYSLYGHGKARLPQTAWGFRFHDSAQLMGERAAREEIRRTRRASIFGKELRGPAEEYMTKAIAEHFLEFYCHSAATPAMAIMAAALRSLPLEKGRTE